jgi:tripartite-type tricarboxylate transporter receptor subunit TctC
MRIEPLYEIIAWGALRWAFFARVALRAMNSFIDWITGASDRQHEGQMCNGRRHWVFLASFVIVAFCQGTSPANSAEEFFAGKQVKVIVSTQAGGDYDTWMRLISPYMARYIPGSPTFVVQNMPGAGSIIATNYLYNVAPRDGTVFGMIGRTLPFQAVVGEKGIRFDPTRLNWLGSPELTNRVCAARPTAEVASIHDLFEHQLAFGGAGAGSALSTIPKLLSRLLGMRLKLVEGYQGPRDIFLAIDRGELDGVCLSVTAIHNIRPGWIESGDIRLLFNMESDRLPGADVPSIYEFTKTDDQRRILSLYSASVMFGRPIVAPPDVPIERVNVLKTAFEKAMADTELNATAKKLGLEIGVVKGDELARLMVELMTAPRDLVDRLKGYIE